MIKPYTELPRLPGGGAGADIPLVPNSGIQFIDVPLPLESLRISRDWYEVPLAEGLAALKQLRAAPDEGGYAYESDGRTLFVSADEEGR